MRRKDREITDIADLLALIDQCKVCRLGLVDDSQPYIVPLNFGYSYANNVLTLFFHSAHEGRKIDSIRKNASACFELDCDHALIEGKQACNYSFAYSSVIGFGTVAFVTAAQEKTDALNAIMRHQTGRETPHRFGQEQLDAVTVFTMTVRECTGKRKTV